MMELNKIYCGDNCDLLGQLPRDCVDLVVTSPPYDDLRTYGGHTWDFYGVAWQLKRVLKPGGVIVWVVADATKDGSETGTSMEQALHFKRLGLNLHDTMIYKVNGTGAKGSNLSYWQAWEYMFIVSKGTPLAVNRLNDRQRGDGRKKNTYSGRTDDRGNRNSFNRIKCAETVIRDNVWMYSVGFMSGSSDAIAYDHPAIFPEKLAQDHILSWSNPGDLVLDPFTGSGTTCKAAKELGRNFLGFEINPGYCKIAERRIAQEVLDFAS